MEVILDSSFIEGVKNFAGNGYIMLFLLSLMPVTELRLSIPIGIILLGMPWPTVFFICVVSNALVGIFLIVSLDYIISLCSRVSFLDSLLKRIMVLSEKKYNKYEKYRSYALVLFVGIPLPGTGAWTGSLISYALGLKRGSSISSIIQGVIISGIVMTVLCVSGKIILS